MSRPALFAAALGLLVAACGDATGGGNTSVPNTAVVTGAQAHEIFLDLSSALGNAYTKQLNDPNGDATTETVGCSSSGSVVVSNLPNTTAVSGSFSITLAFKTCGGSTLTLDGSVVYAGQGSSDATTGQSEFSGAVTLTGAATGTCVVKLTLTTSNSSTVASGTVCALDATAVFS